MIFESCNKYKNRKLFMFFYLNIKVNDVRDSREDSVIVLT